MRHQTPSFFILSLLSIAIFIASIPVAAQEKKKEAQAIDLVLAQKYFQEAEAICKQDNGRLWGIPCVGR